MHIAVVILAWFLSMLANNGSSAASIVLLMRMHSRMTLQ